MGLAPTIRPTIWMGADRLTLVSRTHCKASRGVSRRDREARDHHTVLRCAMHPPRRARRRTVFVPSSMVRCLVERRKEAEVFPSSMREAMSEPKGTCRDQRPLGHVAYRWYEKIANASSVV